jgi:hypothetical protein
MLGAHNAIHRMATRVTPECLLASLAPRAAIGDRGRSPQETERIGSFPFDALTLSACIDAHCVIL